MHVLNAGSRCWWTENDASYYNVDKRTDAIRKGRVMNKASVPFHKIKKELLSDPAVKAEYDSLDTEYKVISQMIENRAEKDHQALICELQALSGRNEDNNVEYQEKLKKWYELKRQKIIDMLLPVLISMYGNSVEEIIMYEDDELGFVNLAILLSDSDVDTIENKELIQKEAERIEMKENLCGNSIMIWTFDYDAFAHHDNMLYDTVRSGHTIYSRL